MYKDICKYECDYDGPVSFYKTNQSHINVPILRRDVSYLNIELNSISD